MPTYEILSLVLNFILVVLAGGTIWVVVLIYKYQKSDEERRLNELRKLEFRPKIEGGRGTEEVTLGRFYTAYTFTNDALNIRIEDVVSNMVKINSISRKIIRHKEKEILNVFGNYESDKLLEFRNHKYTYSIVFDDFEGNSYVAFIEAVGAHASILKQKPVL